MLSSWNKDIIIIIIIIIGICYWNTDLYLEWAYLYWKIE